MKLAFRAQLTPSCEPVCTVLWIPFWNFADETQRLCEKRIGAVQIHCLFTVIRCSFANDGILRLLQVFCGERVERHFPLVVGPISENSLINSLFLRASRQFEGIPSVVEK